MIDELRHGFYLNPEIYTSLKGKDERFNIALRILAEMIRSENFEAAQAIRDAMIEFFREIKVEIPDDPLLNIPSIETVPPRGIICYARPDDPFGLLPGHAEFL